MIKLSKEAYQVLQEIIENEDTPDYWEKRCTNLTKREDSILRGCFSELKRGDMISVRWADGYPYFIQVNKDGYLYDDYVKEQKRASMSQFEIELADILERGESVKKRINGETTPGSDFEAELRIQEWFNDVEIFYNKYLIQHVLGDKIRNIVQYTIHDGRDFMKLSSYFSSIARDKAFLEKMKGIQKKIVPAYQAKMLPEYDIFLSHANADKENFVDELSASLEKLGIRIFYDKTSLEWGDNWKDRILEGTKKAEFAIIVISENFFDREWTEKELAEFLSRQNRNGQKLILPIIHNITNGDLRKKYPSVADIQTIDSQKYTCDEIALLFARQLIKRLKMEN